jgi:hypothetical protein
MRYPIHSYWFLFNRIEHNDRDLSADLTCVDVGGGRKESNRLLP